MLIVPTHREVIAVHVNQDLWMWMEIVKHAKVSNYDQL